MFRSLPRRALLWAPLAAVLLAPNAFAAGNDHREQIPIESWSFGPSASSSSSSSGGGAGKVHYSDLSVMISLEKASSLLQLAVADGEHDERAATGSPGTGKTMAAEVLASSHSGGANFAFADGSVRF